MYPNEQLWLEQLEKGENDAFRVLFDKFYAKLGIFACKYTGEQVIAEDIAQEVLYELWLKKLHFENIWALKVYLYNMARNRCLDILKHRKVEEKYLTEQSYKENSEFFLHRIMEEEIYALLEKAISALPIQTGKVFELYLSGHSNDEIAEILHLSADAVKAHKKRGKKILQEKMKAFIFFLHILLKKSKYNDTFLTSCRF